MAFVAQAYNELEDPKAWSQGPPLIYDSSIILLLLSMRSRKFLSLLSDVWNVIFH